MQYKTSLITQRRNFKTGFWRVQSTYVIYVAASALLMHHLIFSIWFIGQFIYIIYVPMYEYIAASTLHIIGDAALKYVQSNFFLNIQTLGYKNKVGFNPNLV